MINEALACGLGMVSAENCGAVRDVRSMVGVFVFEESLENHSSAIAHNVDLIRDASSGWLRH